jgi:hypothetical protein
MIYAGKPLPAVLADGERRRQEQADRERLHVQRVARKLRGLRWGCSLLGLLGLTGAAVAFALPISFALPVVLLAVVPPNLIIARSWGVLRGLFAGGLLAGLPGITLIVTLSHAGLPGGDMGQAVGLAQFIVLFFAGLGFPMIAGGICGLLRDQLDDDLLQI